jgi:hypothetical protein
VFNGGIHISLPGNDAEGLDVLFISLEIRFLDMIIETIVIRMDTSKRFVVLLRRISILFLINPKFCFFDGYD